MVDGAPPRARGERWLILGLIVGVALVIVPFVTTAVSLARASNAEGGLRGATKDESKQDEVAFALGSASLSALLIPPGILIAVLSGLSLKERRRRSTKEPS